MKKQFPERKELYLYSEFDPLNSRYLVTTLRGVFE